MIRLILTNNLANIRLSEIQNISHLYINKNFDFITKKPFLDLSFNSSFPS